VFHQFSIGRYHDDLALEDHHQQEQRRGDRDRRGDGLDLVGGRGLAVEMPAMAGTMVWFWRRAAATSPEIVVGQQEAEQPVVITPGHMTGMMTREERLEMRAAIDARGLVQFGGMFWKNERSIQIVKGWLIATSTAITAQGWP
jgi:hypothetical protein